METAGGYHSSCSWRQDVPYFKTQQRSVSIQDTCHAHLTCLAFASFDEVHFGKFAARYIKTRYFVDVHPPLAKLLITAAAFIFGFNGDFDFKEIGK